MHHYSAIRRIILFAVLSAITGCDLISPDPTGDLEGFVYNEFQQPLVGATITLDSGPNARTTNSDFSGRYGFQGIQPKEYLITVTRGGYISHTQRVLVSKDSKNTTDFILKAGETTLAVSDSIIDSAPNAGSVEIHVESNASWTIDNLSAWLVCSASSGVGNSTFRLSWQRNPSFADRMDSLKVVAGDTTRTIKVIQGSELGLLSFRGVIGDGQHGIEDSVVLEFNRPVKVNYIRSQEYCISDIGFSQADSNNRIVFSFPCARLGSEWPFEFSVHDQKGTTLTQAIQVPFYHKKIDVVGEIVNTFLDDKTGLYWMVTHAPSRMLIFRSENMELLRDFDLPIEAAKVVLNPYNRLLYAFSNQYDSTVFVLSPDDGRLLKTIPIARDSSIDATYPTIYPYDIGLTATGYGAVLLRAGTSALRWKVIDAQANDSVSIHPQWGYDFDLFPYFLRVYLNFDKSKLLLLEQYGSCTVDVLDGSSHTFQRIIPPSCTRGVFLTPNRTDNRIYFGQLYNQFIMDFQGNMSKVSYIDNRNDGTADFSYRPNQESIIYFFDGGYFSVLDYENAITVMWCDVVGGLGEATTTLDGKYVLAHRTPYPNSEILVFDTEDFYRYFGKQPILAKAQTRRIW